MYVRNSLVAFLVYTMTSNFTGLKTNKERCREIIDKVLRLSRWIYDKLAAIAKSGERAKGDLAEVENSLISGANTLTAILGELEKIHARSRFNTFLGRGVEDLNILDRAVDDLEKRLLRDIVFDMKLQQGMPVSGKNMDPTLHPPTDNLVHVLPPKPHLMIEREDHLKHALDILLRPETSRIAIIGGGGFGKTTLALTILHDPKIVERYQSQYFLSCEGMLDIDTLLLKFGSMLGLNVAPSVILASARRLLGTSTALACFDNFETPWEAFDTRTTKVEELLEFFADIPNLSLIITLRGEHHPSKVMWSRPLLPPLVTLSLDGAKDVLRNIASDHIIDEFTVQLLQAIDGIPLAVTLVSTLLRDGESSESLWGRWSADYTEVIHTGGDDHQSNLDRSIALSVYSLRMDKDVSDGYEPLSVFDICNTHFRDSSPEFVPMSKNEISPYHSSYDQMSLPRVDRTQPREANPSPLSSRASIVPVGEERSLITHANEHAMKEKIHS
ncbi:P-loop containing nucleoside triphosphate hydrolase protein [Pholiota molesta]|nr:P-loop containing nucleoside triphosphate hydrolase protein [Pholiota molesta]